MKHFHGTPLGGTRESVARFVLAANRYFLIPFPHQDDLPIVAESSSGFCLDNGAFTAWRKGKPVSSWKSYYKWVEQWALHPRFDFAIIPDVIDGDEEQNDALIEEWGNDQDIKKISGNDSGAPVWHLHESLDRLERLVSNFRLICLGSSNEYATVGTEKWKHRMAQSMNILCDSNGRPRRKIHGLRMLAPDVVRRYPFYSCDSTNMAQNSQLVGRFGQYKPPTQCQRREVIATRIEQAKSPSVWVESDTQLDLFEMNP